MTFRRASARMFAIASARASGGHSRVRIRRLFRGRPRRAPKPHIANEHPVERGKSQGAPALQTRLRLRGRKLGARTAQRGSGCPRQLDTSVDAATGPIPVAPPWALRRNQRRLRAGRQPRGPASAEYPKLWPETVRALLVHSCRYTPTMTACFDGLTRRRRAEALVRCFGYGVPDLERSRYSARNELTLVLEREIQPF